MRRLARHTRSARRAGAPASSRSPARRTAGPTRPSSSTPSAWSRARSCGSPASRPAPSPASTSPPQKTALVTFEVDSKFPEFKADASCSSEPQSLIAEYFLNCQPGTSTQPLNGPIPAARNKTTVQPDLAQNTLREPFKDRLQLLINEFGTALDGNAENLNAAIRAGAPALQQLKQVLNILGNQNRTIAELNANADAIFAQLANRREDVVHFIDNAGRTAAISAERSQRPRPELPPARRLPLPS